MDSTTLQKQMDAAFDVFIDKYAETSLILTSPIIPMEVRAAMVESLRDVYNAGFSSAYAAFVVNKITSQKNEPPESGTDDSVG
jgi:hypothetical protein